jgi:uncharacterized membrane protein
MALSERFPRISRAGMSDQVLQTVKELVLWTAVGAVLVAVAVYVIGKIRAEAVQHEPTASELLSKFRDQHSKGELTDAEFRTIKTTLAARLQEELKDNGQKG